MCNNLFSNWPAERRWCGKPCSNSYAYTVCRHPPDSCYTLRTSTSDEPVVCDAASWLAPAAQCCRTRTPVSTAHRRRAPSVHRLSASPRRHELDTCSTQRRRRCPPGSGGTATGPQGRTAPRSIPGERQGCTSHRRGLHWRLYTHRRCRLRT